MWSSCGPLSAQVPGIHLRGNFLPSPPLSQPQACSSVFWRQKEARTASWQNSTKKKKKSCLSYLRAKQWAIDSATNFLMPLFWDKDGSQQNKKEIWTLLKAVTQTDSGLFPSGNKVNKLSQCENKFSSVYGIDLHDEYNKVSFTERDWALKKVFSTVSWWNSGRGTGRSTLGHQADQQEEPGDFRNPVSESSQIAPHQLNALYISFSLPDHWLWSHQTPPCLGYLF